LLENAEYYPIATVIDLSGETKPIMYFDGNENPLSEDLITKYNEILETKIKNSEIRAFAIAYEVRVTRNNESEKIDAIAIKIKHIETEEVIIYFYPYTLTQERKLIMGDSWGEIQK
jgi:hypothetical protein